MKTIRSLAVCLSGLALVPARAETNDVATATNAVAALPAVVVTATPITQEESVARDGADRVFVLQVGRVERSLRPPRRPWEVARVSFEIARGETESRPVLEGSSS